MDISKLIAQIVEDCLDDMNLECTYDEKHSCFISPVVAFSDKIAAKAVKLVVGIYPDAFDLSVYSAAYSPVQENMEETMTFMGLLNNVMYPGTVIKYVPGGTFHLYRYVDCINTAGKAPSIEKVRMNLNILLTMYERVIDLAVAVDLGYVSAIDAFKTLLEQ
ncbi:MAG: hypothetical protein PUG60_07280 [Lachnospiraceae bacterium]|nr:hypothetical protein [Lachnospiraceae bacterium]MDY4970446.1 hypothetical protein [Lachnospiraceae bacterium]